MSYSIKKKLTRCPNYLLVIISILVAVLSIELFFPLASSAWRIVFRNFIEDNNTFCIYAVGGSTMEGFPLPCGINPATITQKIFNGKIKGKEIKVITIARAAEDIHTQFIRLEKELLLAPSKNAVILLYSGINEFSAYPIKDTAIFSKWAILRKSVILKYCIDFLKISDIAVLTDYENEYIQYLRYSSILKYKYFLNQTALLAKKNNIPLIVSTLTCNIAGFNPLPLYKQNNYVKNNFSHDLQKLTEAFLTNTVQAVPIVTKISKELENFKKTKEITKYNFIPPNIYNIYLDGLRKEQQGEFEKAIESYNQVLQKTKTQETKKLEDYDHINTAASFRIGKSLEKLKHFDLAQDAYKKAQPLFYPCVKPPLVFNQIIKETAKKHNLLLTDTEQIIIEHSKNNLPNYDMFFDAHHPNYKSAILLSYGFAQQIQKLTGEKIKDYDITESKINRLWNLNTIDKVLPYIRSCNWIFVTVNTINEENIEVVSHYIEEIKNLLTLSFV